MLLWLILSIGTVLALAAMAAFAAMSRAERRARDAFYLSLGYSQETVVGLKRSKGAVGAELARMRQAPDASAQMAAAAKKPPASE
jgi:hypothetical protein